MRRSGTSRSPGRATGRPRRCVRCSTPTTGRSRANRPSAAAPRRCYLGRVNRTVDDTSSITEDEPAIPGIVMVASGPAPAQLVLPVPAELGRRIAAGGKTHEIDDERMSRDHALVTTERGLWVISDRDSRNGTFVDGERVHGEVRRR